MADESIPNPNCGFRQWMNRAKMVGLAFSFVVGSAFTAGVIYTTASNTDTDHEQRITDLEEARASDLAKYEKTVSDAVKEIKEVINEDRKLAKERHQQNRNDLIEIRALMYRKGDTNRNANDNSSTQVVNVNTDDMPDVEPGTWIDTATMARIKGVTRDGLYYQIAQGQHQTRKKPNGRLEVLYEGP